MNSHSWSFKRTFSRSPREHESGGSRAGRAAGGWQSSGAPRPFCRVPLRPGGRGGSGPARAARANGRRARPERGEQARRGRRDALGHPPARRHGSARSGSARHPRNTATATEPARDTGHARAGLRERTGRESFPARAGQGRGAAALLELPKSN